ncbi:MAG: hypothetical protein LBJ14_01200 [Desulfarculales bacterium]|jgi:hypothetical protein|nr:hypothetical protein [Desulfarculales bacterium]
MAEQEKSKRAGNSAARAGNSAAKGKSRKPIQTSAKLYGNLSAQIEKLHKLVDKKGVPALKEAAKTAKSLNDLLDKAERKLTEIKKLLLSK